MNSVNDDTDKSDIKSKIAKNIVIISGPSGSGQDTIINAISKQIPIKRVITTTTREKRKNESEGHPYHFISKKDFLRKLDNNEFVEWAKHYNDNYYGVDISELSSVASSGRLGIWKTEHQGVKAAKDMFPGIIAIMIYANPKTLEKRLQKRADMSPEELQERMQYTRRWLSDKNILNLYDFIVKNEDGKLNEAINKILEFLKLKNKI